MTCQKCDCKLWFLNAFEGLVLSYSCGNLCTKPSCRIVSKSGIQVALHPFLSFFYWPTFKRQESFELKWAKCSIEKSIMSLKLFQK